MVVTVEQHSVQNIHRAGETEGAGGTVAPPIFHEIRKKVAFSNPNIFRLQE